jgi:hypothetical protein
MVPLSLWKRLATLVVPPSAAFVLARAVVLLSATNAGVQSFTEAPWFGGDAGIYLSIARDGYDLVRCNGPSYQPGQWCGNAGWLPGYPWLVHALVGVASTPEAWALALPALFHWATLVVLWIGFLKARLEPKCLAVLGLAALFPAQIYYHAGFPISQFLFFAMIALLLLVQGRIWLGAAAGAMAAFTYSTGFILAGVFGVWTLVAFPRRRWLAGALAGGLVFAGFVAVLAVHQLTVGRWNAFFLVQEKYGHSIGSPVRAFRVRTGPLLDLALWRNLDTDAISLKAANGRLLVAEGGGGRAVLANRDAAGPWERFDVVRQKDGTVALRAFGGQFLSVSATATEVEASAALVGAHEQFRLVADRDTRVALQGPDGTYVSLGAGSDGPIVSGSRQIGANELFEMTRVENASIARMAAAGNSLLVFGLMALGVVFSVRSRSGDTRGAAPAQVVRHTAEPSANLPPTSRLSRFRDSLAAQEDRRLELVVLVYSLAFYVIPMVISAQATARRAESLLLPVTFLLRRAPLIVQLAALAVSGYFAMTVAHVYFVTRD